MHDNHDSTAVWWYDPLNLQLDLCLIDQHSPKLFESNPLIYFIFCSFLLSHSNLLTWVRWVAIPVMIKDSLCAVPLSFTRPRNLRMSKHRSNYPNKDILLTVDYFPIQLRQYLLTKDWILFDDGTSIEYTKHKEPMVSFHRHLLERDLHH